MAFKLIVLAAVLAAANAGLVTSYAPASVAVATPTITSQSQNTLRSYGNLGQVSTYHKSIDTPFSSVRKSDVRVSNDALAYAAAPAVAYHAAPAVAAYHAAPAVTAYHAAPAVAAYHAPAVAAYHAAPAVAAYHTAAPVAVAKTGLLGVAYSAAPAVAHLAFDGYGVHYGY